MLLRVIWIPIVMAGVAILGYLYFWPLEMLAPILSVLVVIGIFMAVSYDRQRNLEHSLAMLKEVGAYFVRRFSGNSPLSIFVVIEGLINAENPAVREWVHCCSMSRLILNSWCDSFILRMESESRAGTLSIYMRTYLRELWSLVIHYQDFIEQFHEVAEKSEFSQDTIAQYNRFTIEYNSFSQRFRDFIGDLRGVNKTEIEPPSIKLAKELPVKRHPQPEPKEERKLPKHDEHKGYIIG
ncbi:hypothetical protein ACFLV5_02355 [Chloroflexota bacterium]